MSSEGLTGIVGLANYDPNRGGVSLAMYGNDKGLMAEFYTKAEEVFFDGTNPDGSPKPVTRKTFKNVEMVHIFAPGNKTDYHRPVKVVDDGIMPPDPVRFPRQWAAFKAQQEQVSEGMPLEEWAILSKAEVMEWKACKVHTVQQLANIPDTAAHNFPMNFRSVRDKAVSWLKSSEGDTGEVVALKSENEILKGDVAMMKQQIAELAAAQTKRGPGRPRKDEGDSNAE